MRTKITNANYLKHKHLTIISCIFQKTSDSITFSQYFNILYIFLSLQDNLVVLYSDIIQNIINILLQFIENMKY